MGNPKKVKKCKKINEVLEFSNYFISKNNHREVLSKEKGKRDFSITKFNNYNHSENTDTGITNSKNDEKVIIVINKQNDYDKKSNNWGKAIFSKEEEFIIINPGDKVSVVRKSGFHKNLKDISNFP